MLASARHILADIGKTDFTSISIDDVGDPAHIFADTVFNGDGIIPEMAAEDDATRALIREIGETIGTVPDRSGKPGIDGTLTEAFFAEARAYSAWYARGEESLANVFPLGPERTASAAAAVAAIKTKVDDYFGRCPAGGVRPARSAGPEPQPGGVPPDRSPRPDDLRRRGRRIPAGAGGCGSAVAPVRSGQPGLRHHPPDAPRRRGGARCSATARRSHRGRLARRSGRKLAPYDAWLAGQGGRSGSRSSALARVREILALGRRRSGGAPSSRATRRWKRRRPASTRSSGWSRYYRGSRPTSAPTSSASRTSTTVARPSFSTARSTSISVPATSACR